MIPVYLVTGFLGSGKTTLLKEIYRQNKNRRFIYLINEFSVRDVDAAFLGQECSDVISVPGGSIFCTCLVSEFISRLREILARQNNHDSAFEGLVIEASGTANPAVIRTLLKDSKLDASFHIQKIITVVDPYTLPKLLHTLPNIRQQIAVADLIVLNKTDLADEDEIESLRKTIHSLNETAEMWSARYCSLTFNLLSNPRAHAPHSLHEPVHQPQRVFKKFSLQTRKTMDFDLLNEFLDKHAGDIYRIKGFIQGENGTLMHLDYSLSSGLIKESADVEVQPHLEFIFNGDRGDVIRERINYFFKHGFR